MIFTNPPLTGKAGRPRTTHCKRGHKRVAEETSCVSCRRYRERLKYERNEAFRESKKSYQRDYRAAFYAEHGYGIHCA